MLVIGSIVIVALVIALPLYALYVIYRPAVSYMCELGGTQAITFDCFLTENDSVFECADSWFKGRTLLSVVQRLGHLEKSHVCRSELVHLCHHSLRSFGE